MSKLRAIKRIKPWINPVEIQFRQRKRYQGEIISTIERAFHGNAEGILITFQSGNSLIVMGHDDFGHESGHTCAYEFKGNVKERAV